MREGAEALAKLRAYAYLIFAFDVALLLHSNIAELLDTSDRKILYGFVLLSFFQVTMCVLLIVKYATTVQRSRQKKVIIMYSARVRIYCIMQYIILLMMVGNEAFSLKYAYWIDKFLVLLNILFLVFLLKNLTVLQRKRY